MSELFKSMSEVFKSKEAVKAAEAEERRKLEASRRMTLARLSSDPFVGYESLDKALEESMLTSQPEVLARLLKRENLFISGFAGSGKTTIINRFIELLDAQYDGEFNVAVTASTGIAATLLGGRTIHSWSGLGVDTTQFDRKNISGMMVHRLNEIKNADVLIIDEISMLPGYLFTKLDEWMQYARKNDSPFGGVQLVLIGDFLQLPPVSKSSDAGLDTRFAIETASWKAADITHCFLDKTYRATDDRLKRVLNEIAGGKISEKSEQLINTRIGQTPDPNKVYTTLFTTNANVDKHNNEKLAENPNEPVMYVAKSHGEKKDVDKAFKRYNIPPSITLKRDATVIMSKNTWIDGVFIPNGSIGKVISISKGDSTPLVRFNSGVTVPVTKECYVERERVERIIIDENGKKRRIFEEIPKATVTQTPLRLGYAITVHRSQGQTFDGVYTDLSKCFQPGLGYVALSRVRTLDDLIITKINSKAFAVSEKSRRITVFVKKKALLARKEFKENKEDYEALLSSELMRDMYWSRDNG